MATLRTEDTSDEAPLLGERGDASLPGGRPLYHNFVLGTAVVAQAGAWIIAAIVWGSVFSNDLILFSVHPLLNSAAFLLLIQAILVVQPTHTAQQKKEGTYAHAALNDIGVLTAIAGLVVIEYNKISHNGTHFESAHARLGLVAYILVILQVLVGFTQYFTPGLYGGEANAKSLYKYHRVGGYITTVVMLATICAATYTTYNVNVMKIQLWAVVVASVLVVLGVAARVRLSKFGWMAGK